MPGSEQGRTTSTACATARCIGDVASLLTAGAAGLRCYGCLAPQLTTESRNLSTSLRQSAGFICEPFVGLLPRLTLPVLVAA
jgi:hypothetical protein